MSYCLVQFVEDNIYHVCSSKSVKCNPTEQGLVTAKYRGSCYRAVIISEGDKGKMIELKERCELNEVLKNKYKLTTTPSPTATSVSHVVPDDTSKIRKNLFGTDTSEKTYATLTNIEPVVQSKRKKIETFVPQQYTTIEERSIDMETTEWPVVEDAGEVERRDVDEYQLTSSGTVVEEYEERALERTVTLAEESIQTPKEVKKYYCPYCRSMYRKFSRHIFQVHSEEKDVRSIVKLDAKHPERLRVLAALRAKGARIFNNLTSSPSKIIVSRKKKEMNMVEYIQCYLCGSMYKKKYLHRHLKKCPKSDGSGSRQAIKLAKQQSWKIEEEDHEVIKFYEHVISGMLEGNLKKTILNDSTILAYGKFLCCNYGKDTHLINVIRRKLREVAAILMKVKELDSEVLSMEDVFQPSKKQVLFEAIKTVTGYAKGIFKRPAMANELSTILQACAQRLLVNAQEREDEDKEKKISRWLNIIRSEYNVYIGKHARKTMEENQWNKPKTLPMTADVMKLNLHVKEVCKKATESLSKEFSFPVWSRLNRGTLVNILLFNRKRVGDVQRMRVEDFEKSHNIQKGSTTYELLSESEKIYCAKYRRVETRGKRGKGVPIILTKGMVDSIRLIISLRDLAEIPKHNSFVFAKQDDKPFPASSSLRDLAFECGATSPQLLTGTKLRKEIATATQAFNFSENDLSILAKFMGHTLHTHSHFYRLPDEATQLAKISVVLQAIDSGKIADLKGKSLEELETLVKKLIEEADDSTEQQQEEQHNTPSKPKTSKESKKVLRTSWCTPEKHAMRRYFKRHLQNFTLPNLDECDDARKKNSPLKRRTVMQIKAWVNNENKRVQKSKPK